MIINFNTVSEVINNWFKEIEGTVGFLSLKFDEGRNVGWYGFKWCGRANNFKYFF